jgi:2,3-bisphosphoglycerate-independent phosphoglycerate mutase
VTADVVNTFVTEARRLLADESPANMILLRGFDQLPEMPRFPEIFKLRAAAIAAYPMYRGLARLVGMEILKTGAGFADEVATLRQHWDAYDFFFLHYKDTDKAGEDGDFDAKVQALERLDGFIPEILARKPDVMVVTGDHASPSILAGHGWQPVPVVLAGPYAGADPVSAFSERACAAGTLGIMPAQHLMPLVLANALRLTKFGA